MNVLGLSFKRAGSEELYRFLKSTRRDIYLSIERLEGAQRRVDELLEKLFEEREL